MRGSKQIHIPVLQKFAYFLDSFALSDCQIFDIDLSSAFFLHLFEIPWHLGLVILSILTLQVMPEMAENFLFPKTPSGKKLEKFVDLGKSNSLLLIFVQEDSIWELDIETIFTKILPKFLVHYKLKLLFAWDNINFLGLLMFFLLQISKLDLSDFEYLELVLDEGFLGEVDKRKIGQMNNLLFL